MVLICDNTTAAMALLFKQNELRDIKITDLNAECCQQFSTFTITAVFTFNCLFHFFLLLFLLIIILCFIVGNGNPYFPKVFTENLRDLEEDGILSRTVYPKVLPKAEYPLTEKHRQLKCICAFY